MKGKKMDAREMKIREEAVKQDESANYAIEDLTHALEAAATIAYKDWCVQSDGWTHLSISTFLSRKSVDVIKSKLNVAHMTVALSVGPDIVFSIDVRAKDNAVSYVVIPMIEQFLQGDREEIKLALNPLLEISPAIN